MSKLAHVILQTSNYNEMKEFYKTLLGGTTSFENEQLSFITYDEEHYRVGKMPDRRNHGLTTSMYYRDSDGNQIETQVDNMEAEEATAFMASPKMAEKPIGVDFDPEELCKRLESGESEETIKSGEGEERIKKRRDGPGVIEELHAVFAKLSEPVQA